MTGILLTVLLTFFSGVQLSPYVLNHHDIALQKQAYWVFFTDKDGVDFDPYTYFDQKAIDRRIKHGLNLYDTLSFPLRNDYLQELNMHVDSLCITSRWFNAAFVYAFPTDMAFVEQLPFVRVIEPAGVGLLVAEHNEHMDVAGLSSKDSVLLAAQLGHMQGELFHKNNVDGRDVRIAVFDAGFRGVNTHPAFRHLKMENRIVATYDFHRQRDNVFVSSAHGTMVLSALAGIIDGRPAGLATGAEFLLARTEIRREPLAEEKYWLAAAEWADRLGADIINSSLGYVFHRYFPEEMDGKTSMVARAASMAARKGILVVNSAGNQGNDELWRIVVTPADVDSVLTVGALEYPSMLKAPYSSVGPTADGRMKPNVSAIGNIVAASRRRIATPQGTSFAGPLVAGFAACLWQMYPNWTNMQLFEAIERSGNLFPYYDYAHGYGTPQASAFFEQPAAQRMPTFDIHRHDDTIKIILRKRINSDKQPEDAIMQKKQYLYYQKKNADNTIAKYYVIDLEGADKISIPVEGFLPGQQLLVHYNGYTAGYLVN